MATLVQLLSTMRSFVTISSTGPRSISQEAASKKRIGYLGQGCSYLRVLCGCALVVHAEVYPSFDRGKVSVSN
jgi:hypothetical protein